MPSNYTADRQPGVLRSLDWWTIGIYIALLTFGWVSVCGASYTYGDTRRFSHFQPVRVCRLCGLVLPSV